MTLPEAIQRAPEHNHRASVDDPGDVPAWDADGQIGQAVTVEVAARGTAGTGQDGANVTTAVAGHAGVRRAAGESTHRQHHGHGDDGALPQQHVPLRYGPRAVLHQTVHDEQKQFEP